MSAQDLTPAERNRFARTLDRLQSGARLRIHLGDDFELQTEIDLIPSWDHAIRTALIADMQRTLGLDPDPPPAAPALALPVPEMPRPRRKREGKQMSSINRVTLMGRLGADPEVRNLQSGDKAVNLRLATSETWKDKTTGERKERTEWHSVVIFDQRIADVAAQYLRKGNLVYLEGMLSTRQWEDQSGQKRYTTEVVLKQFNGELKLLPQGAGGPPKADSPESYGQVSGRTSAQPEKPMSSGMREALDDEIPF